MKNKLLFFIATIVAVLSFPKVNFGQVPNLGTAANFVLFTTNGAVTNNGISHLTGHVGSNVGGSTGFGNVDGVMHDQDPASAQATADLLVAYGQLDAAIPAFFPALLLGNGQTLNAGVYSIAGNATLNLSLNLDAQGDPNALFIIQVEGTMSTNANSKVNLLNGAKACNVFWKVEGLVSMAVGTKMRGTIVANNAAIAMNAGDTLEGRALSINGAIGVDGIFAYTPLGCLAPILTGPANPILGSTECFVLFSGIGPVTNVGVTTVTGDVGSNNGLTTGFNPLLVTGTIHGVPDGATAQCATDFTTVYNAMTALPYDIELLYPAQFGNDLVLTPHVYLMNSAVTFTDSLYLNAQGNPDAVFVFQVNGAFGTSTYSNIILINGAQAKNVYWVMNGALDINDYSIFNGTIISQGAINLMTGVTLYGRALTGVGAVSTSAVNAIMPTSCAPFTVTEPVDQTTCDGGSASFTVVATGISLTYQWRKGNVNLVDGGNISGATTSTLTINPATISDQATDYNVVMTGSFVPNDTSNYVSLTIVAAPIITTQPLDQIACIGDSVAFTVVASGSGLTYQWRKGLVNLVNGPSISGATTATLSIDPTTALDAGIDYNVVVTGGCLPGITSNNVALTFNAAPIIVTQPLDQAVCNGDSVAFTVVATGLGLTYQWRRGLVNLVNGVSISGVTTATLSIDPTTALDAGNDYNVVVSGSCSPGVTSANASLTFNNCSIDLGVVKTASNMTPQIGSTITFTIIATNLGSTNATGVEVNEILQSGYTYISSTTTSGSYNPLTGIWIIGAMNTGTSETLTITATVIADGNYVNNALVYAIENDSVMANNISTIEPIPFDFFIPEGFSPNGDLINDLFVIRGILNFPSNTFTIFNRWGVKVFDASPYQNTWDGKSNAGGNLSDDVLPVGTYFYVLDLGDGSEFYKGTIYLNN